jgi:hypothetical protein
VLCWIEEINGYGVFAGRPYHQHEFIALYSGTNNKEPFYFILFLCKVELIIND